MEFDSKRIPELSPAEAAEITSLINRANSGRRDLFTGDRMGPTSLVDQYQECEVVRLTSDGVCLGSVTLLEKEQALWIYLLAVDRPYQKRGLGSLLLDYALREASQRRLCHLELEAVDEGGLLAYYRGLGFSEVGRATKPEGHWGSVRPFDLVTLRKPVPGPETFLAT